MSTLLRMFLTVFGPFCECSAVASGQSPHPVQSPNTASPNEKTCRRRPSIFGYCASLSPADALFHFC